MNGEIIKQKRTEKGYSQAKLGDIVGVSGAYIQQLEKGTKKNPSLETITAIANALDISSKFLLEENNLSYDLLSALCDNFMGISGMYDNVFIAIEDSLGISFDTLQGVKGGVFDFSYDDKMTIIHFLEGIYHPKYLELKRRVDNEYANETHLERWFYYLIEDRYGNCIPDSYGISFPSLDRNSKIWNKLSFDDIEKLREDIYNYIDFYIYKSKLDKNSKEGE